MKFNLNDFINFQIFQLNNPNVDPREVVRVLYEQWVTLANFGAKYILINQFFDLAYLPKEIRDNDVYKILLNGSVSSVHNAALDFYVERFKQEYKVTLYTLPMNEIWKELQQANVSKEFGLTNFDNACVIRTANNTYTICSSKYIYTVSKVQK